MNVVVGRVVTRVPLFELPRRIEEILENLLSFNPLLVVPGVDLILDPLQSIQLLVDGVLAVYQGCLLLH